MPVRLFRIQTSMSDERFEEIALAQLESRVNIELMGQKIITLSGPHVVYDRDGDKPIALYTCGVVYED